MRVVDPDGWRGVNGRPWEDRITADEFRERAALSTVTHGVVERDDEPRLPTLSMPADMLYRIAEYWRQRAAACTCATTYATYAGPEADCPVHGAVRAANEANAQVAKLTQVAAEWQEAAEQWRVKFVTAQTLADERGAQLSLRIQEDAREEIVEAGLIGPHCVESRVNQHEKCPGCACLCHTRQQWMTLTALRQEAAALAGAATNKALPVADRLACADRSGDLFIQALEQLDQRIGRATRALARIHELVDAAEGTEQAPGPGVIDVEALRPCLDGTSGLVGGAE
jgi:hypothetical protein